MLWLLRRLVPVRLRLVYHAGLVRLAQARYRHPARELVVVAVTGTSGKSTVVWITSHLLAALGVRNGRSSTIDFFDGHRSWLNDLKMTMPGRFFIPRLMRQMVKNTCTVAVIEVTSEGIVQQRHVGLEPDVVALTNLSPEHIESHGSYAKYQATKERLFAGLASARRKRGQKKVIVVNADDPKAPDFLRYEADEKIGASGRGVHLPQTRDLQMTDLHLSAHGMRGTLAFQGARAAFTSTYIGEHNAENIRVAAALALSLGQPLDAIATALAEVPLPPGRFEQIALHDRRVIVDYAFHERALEALYEAARALPHKRIIHVLGGTGGGRDRWRRDVIGKFAGTHADIVVVTNEDPYDEDPAAIALAVAAGAKKVGKMEGENLHFILDRRLAIRRALELATEDDLVLITGKASEQWIVGPHGHRIPWDDRTVVREELARLHDQEEAK
jgi:UDP-N-acetylmuramoyl-L-alanyl-D-glutamate--2,6-diaminopimelate ligase